MRTKQITFKQHKSKIKWIADRLRKRGYACWVGCESSEVYVLHAHKKLFPSYKGDNSYENTNQIIITMSADRLYQTARYCPYYQQYVNFEAVLNLSKKAEWSELEDFEKLCVQATKFIEERREEKDSHDPVFQA